MNFAEPTATGLPPGVPTDPAAQRILYNLYFSPFHRPRNAYIVPVLASIATVICIPALILHVRARNWAVSSVMAWVTLINFFIFTNALIWPKDNIFDWYDGRGWCDIQVKLLHAAGMGIPGGTACVFRQLALILDTDENNPVPTRAQRMRRLACNIFFMFFLPIWIMIAHYIVQPSRYYIFTIAGCVPSYDESWLTIVLVFMLPVAVCALDACYAILIGYRLIKYRLTFSAIVTASSQTNKSRFIRLMGLAVVFTCVFLPTSAYILHEDTQFKRHAYNFSPVHRAGWSHRILRVPTHGVVRWDRWVQIAVAFAIFAFCGFGHDATILYRRFLLALGLGRFFPKLHHPDITEKRLFIKGSRGRGDSAANFKSQASTLVGSMTEKMGITKLLHRKGSKDSGLPLLVIPKSRLKSFHLPSFPNTSYRTNTGTARTGSTATAVTVDEGMPRPTDSTSRFAEEGLHGPVPEIYMLGSSLIVPEPAIWSGSRLVSPVAGGHADIDVEEGIVVRKDLEQQRSGKKSFDEVRL